MTTPIAAFAPAESPDEVALAAAAEVELEDAEVVVLEVVVVLDVELDDELDDDEDEDEEEVTAATPMVVRALQIYQNMSQAIYGKSTAVRPSGDSRGDATQCKVALTADLVGIATVCSSGGACFHRVSTRSIV